MFDSVFFFSLSLSLFALASTLSLSPSSSAASSSGEASRAWSLLVGSWLQEEEKGGRELSFYESLARGVGEQFQATYQGYTSIPGEPGQGVGGPVPAQLSGIHKYTR